MPSMGGSFAENHRAYLAANLRRLRVRAGLTQEELAEAAGVAPYYAQQLEREGGNPTLTVILALAEALAVVPGQLFRKCSVPERPPGRPRKRSAGRKKA